MEFTGFTCLHRAKHQEWDTREAAGAVVTGTTEVWTPARAVRCRRGAGTLRRFRRAGQEGCRTGGGRLPAAVNGQFDLSLALADVVKVGWVSELTRRNATAVAELVAVYAGATHDMLT